MYYYQEPAKDRCYYYGTGSTFLHICISSSISLHDQATDLPAGTCCTTLKAPAQSPGNSTVNGYQIENPERQDLGEENSRKGNTHNFA